MKIHHLNCGSFCAIGHPILNRLLPKLDQFNLVCHCLLIESSDGLILVDTGLGLKDISNQERFKSNFIFNQFARPKLDVEETAYMQIIRKGFNPKDVIEQSIESGWAGLFKTNKKNELKLENEPVKKIMNWFESEELTHARCKQEGVEIISDLRQLRTNLNEHIQNKQRQQKLVS